MNTYYFHTCILFKLYFLEKFEIQCFSSTFLAVGARNMGRGKEQTLREILLGILRLLGDVKQESSGFPHS